MANPTKNATLRAIIDGVLTDIFAKSHISNVVYSVGEDGSEVMLSTKLAEIIADLGTKATSTELSDAIAALRTELMGEGVPEAYDTFKELADYIAAHQEVSDALTAAIGDKADKTTVEAIQTALDALQQTVDGLGALAKKDEVGEDDLSTALKEKVNAASEGNHSHLNKTELDKIAEGDKAKWDAAAEKAHEHANQTELDKIVDGDKAKWDGAAEKVDTLVGDDTGKSARTIANEELAKQLVPENAQESLDTLGEIAAWIQAHPGDAAAMNAAITALQNKLSGIDDGTSTVKTYIENAITALSIGDYAKAADLTALAARVTALEAKGNIYVSATQPEGLKGGDLWIALD